MSKLPLVLVVAAITACSHQPSQPLRVGYMAISECLPLFVAQEQGFFADEGVTVELKAMAGGAPILQALGSQSLDIGFSNVVSLLLQRVHGADFYPVVGASFETPTHQNHALLAAKGSALSALAGKRIAVNTPHNIEELMVRRYLRANHVNPDKVTFYPVGFGQMLPALAAGNIDAVSIVEPFISAASTMPNLQSLGNQYLGVTQRALVAIYVSSGRVQSLRSRELSAFTRAMERAIRFISEHEPEARGSLSKYTALSARDIQRIALPLFAPNAVQGDFAHIRQMMLEEQFLTSAEAAHLDSFPKRPETARP